MRILLLIFFCIIQLSLFSQSNYSRVKVDLNNKSLIELSNLGIETDHGVYARERYFLSDLSQQEIDKLAKAGFSYDIMIADVKAFYINQNDPSHPDFYQSENSSLRNGGPCLDSNGSVPVDYETPSNYTYGSMGGYHTYAEMLAVLDDMKAKYPDLISTKDTITGINTEEGRPIHWLRISDNAETDEDEPEVLYTALHHAREPNSLSQMIFYLWYLLENYESDPQIKYLVDHTEMYFIPCVNPDGYVWNETTSPDGGGLWRKNRHVQDENVVGVDLNRNYGFMWGFDNSGSSPNPLDDTYRGTSGFSEPETQAVRNFALEHEFQIALNYHTFGNLLIHPWGFNDLPTDEDDIFKGLSAVMTAENNFLVGTGVETVGYIVNGDSDDWMYGEQSDKPKIYAMTPESGPNSFGFWPPASAIDELNKLNLLQNLMAAQLVHNYAEVVDRSSQNLSMQSGMIPLSLKAFGLASGDFTVSITSDSPGLIIEDFDNNYTLNNLEEVQFNINYQIVEDETQDFKINIEVDNGLYTYRSSLTKNYISGDFETIWADNDNDISNWFVDGSWDVTTESFNSTPNSITDSPLGEYNNLSSVSITLKEPISLANTENATLRFSTRYAIEKSWDYAQVLISTDGENFTPQCGMLTVIGNENQDENQPLYDGTQLQWTPEVISLNDYLDESIYIQFKLVSDNFVTDDGFYFDDVLVEGVLLDPNSSLDELENISALTVSPNPVSDDLTVRFNTNVQQQNIQCAVYNNMGNKVLQVDMGSRIAGSHELLLNTSILPSGIYHCALMNDHHKISAVRFIKQ